MQKPKKYGNLACIILAGGEGRRLGGVNKALIPYQEKTLIEHLIASLEPQVKHFVISANNDLDRLSELGHPVVSDDIHAEGPLMGLLSVLKQIEYENIILTPCDVTAIPFDYVERLTRKLSAGDSDMVIARTDSQIHYLNCAMRKNIRDKLESFIDSGGRGASEWQKHLAVEYVSFNCLGAVEIFNNINTKEDIEKLGT